MRVRMPLSEESVAVSGRVLVSGLESWGREVRWCR